MASTTRDLILASSTGIIFSSAFFGANAALTFIALPSYQLPAPSKPFLPASEQGLLARQWQYCYSVGSKAGPVLALGSASAFIYASRLVASESSSRALYLGAAALNVMIVPFTALFMDRTNNELHRRANNYTAQSSDVGPKKDAQQGSIEEAETIGLFAWWNKLNLVRASFHLAAAALGVTALNLSL